MSNRYKGGVISATPPTTTGDESGTASGAWTLEQQMQLQAAGLWPAQPTGPYIEQVFSTYLYTGNGSTQTIINGIDLSGKGGLVWCKARTGGTVDHALSDTARGRASYLISNSAAAAGTVGAGDNITSFNTNGFSLGTDNGTNFNLAGEKMVSWTFRKQPKFFDVVTWSGNNTARTIAHNLGSEPGCIIVKKTTFSGDWIVYHRSTGNANFTILNSTSGSQAGASIWNNTSPTSTNFTVGTDSSVNASGQDYVAYIFAHDAGGFGPTGTDNVISCGSFTTPNSSDFQVSLGYEPQFVLTKSVGFTNPWLLFDTMRGLCNYSADTGYGTPATALKPNSAAADEYGYAVSINSTGFTYAGTAGTYIYIAIRRGPMKVPTSGTSVFDTQLGVSSTTATISSGFVTDAALALSRPDGGSGYGRNIYSRLQGNFRSMNTTMTDVESTFTNSTTISFSQNNGIKLNGGSIYNADWVYEQFKRAPGFFDVVCYTGTGTNRTVTHNLGVAPELMLIKNRITATSWVGYCAPLTATQVLVLNSNAAPTTNSFVFLNTEPTSTVFTVGAATSGANENGAGIVAYLFATCAGVSKVGSYTGTGALQTVNCGFTGGARFVLIKRTDSTGDWWTYDSARGITSGNDPYLYLNSTAAEVTTTNYVDTDSTGFKVTAAAPAGLNANGGTYIFLAIA